MSFFDIEIEKELGIIWLNRPEKRNMMNWEFWDKMPQIIDDLNQNDEVKVILIFARGKSFSMGLDLFEFAEKFPEMVERENADYREWLRNLILKMQNAINCIDDSAKPVITGVHKHCVGGALDLISAADIRTSTKDALFSLREAKVGIVADMGSLQRLPYIIGEGHTKELAYTGKDITADEAFQMGLTNHIYESYDEMVKQTKKIALDIAKNPSFVVKGIKHIMKVSRDMDLTSKLNYIATYNSSFLQNDDFKNILTKVTKK